MSSGSTARRTLRQARMISAPRQQPSPPRCHSTIATCRMYLPISLRGSSIDQLHSEEVATRSAGSSPSGLDDRPLLRNSRAATTPRSRRGVRPTIAALAAHASLRMPISFALTRRAQQVDLQLRLDGAERRIGDAFLSRSRDHPVVSTSDEAVPPLDITRTRPTASAASSSACVISRTVSGLVSAPIKHPLRHSSAHQKARLLV